MKHILQYVSVFLLLVFVTACSQSQVATKSTQTQPATAEDKMPWRPDMVKITFADGKTKFGNAISQTATQIQIRMIPNSEEYSISNKGVILSSSGSYLKGSKVQSVTIKKSLPSIYNKVDQPNFDYGILGIRFPDGKVQYAKALSVQSIYLGLTMMHAQVEYNCYYKEGTWKIDIPSGEYKNGTIIRDIFELESKFMRWY